ncbi:plasmid recombination protein [Ruminococcus sp.]|uniref:plasmid recombination protein n=1 Tax=Ruminococcus sp. TaxID=41978 RepID=UPI0038703DFA
MSCARVQTYTAAKISAAERHTERKNTDYSNINVEPERIPMNVHFKSPGDKTYMQILKDMEAEGKVSRRGLRADAVLFDEIIFDINTMYFEERGGYEYAKEFFTEAYRYACEKYGEENIISAVMHADEINKAVSDELGHPVYHYHMHLIALPVVEKEIRWSKRCKDPELVGTVKEIIHQINHSKKWESREPMLDDYGEPIMRKNGKPKFRPSYSILQDEFYQHMTDHGYSGFERGKEGSTVEHLSSLRYQIEKDKKRLAIIEHNIQKAKIEYEPANGISKTYQAINNAGKKNPLTGNYSISKEDYADLTALAKEGITSRAKIGELREQVKHFQDETGKYRKAFNRLQDRYDKLTEKCSPFFQGLEHFPDVVQRFIEHISSLFAEKEKEQQRRLPKARSGRDR